MQSPFTNPQSKHKAGIQKPQIPSKERHGGHLCDSTVRVGFFGSPAWLAGHWKRPGWAQGANFEPSAVTAHSPSLGKNWIKGLPWWHNYRIVGIIQGRLLGIRDDRFHVDFLH
ncbi:hypothetical protein CEXT_766121 [Caerostris extrusa]|uniref:Uncharacterized protein n=1 Tax=Caerostris extrusa TaxID=172846 RepID=A0AAV4VZH7_CAEEX|nr:hypothetical protein CEXT_766121 [Caerostris extrusa]